MRVFCTYCSAEKNNDAGPLPAIERYKDSRIRLIQRKAQLAGCAFMIFSGEFGLLTPEEPIPFYDHLLTEDEVGLMVGHIAAEMSQHGITEFEYFTVPLEADPLVAPYLRAVQLAADKAGVEFRVNYL